MVKVAPNKLVSTLRPKAVASALLLALTAPLALPIVPANAGADEHDHAAQIAFIQSHAAPGSLRFHLDESGQAGVESGHTAPSQILRSSFETLEDLRTPYRYSEAMRSFLEAAWGLRLPDVHNHLANNPSLPAAAGAESVESNVIRFGLPGGDLTGDGLEDALDLEIAFPAFTFGVKAFRGTDGALLWSRDFPTAFDAFPLAAGDLTGDGADDVLLIVFTIDQDVGTCVVIACGFAFTYHWDLEVVSGLDGATAWSKRFDGTAGEAFAFAPIVAFGDAFIATNILVLPFLSDDHDGNGAPDLVVDSFDVVLLFVFAFPTFEFVELVTTRADVVSGPDGAVLFHREAVLNPGIALLQPAGHSVGSPTGDLLWQNFVSPGFACALACVIHATLELELLDGATFATAWITPVVDPVQEFAFGAPAFRDLTGDGADDIVLERFRLLNPFHLVGVVSGATGVRAWETPTGALGIPFPIGPVGGAAGDDLLVVDADFSFDGIDLIFDRLDGANGQSLLRTVRPIPVEGGFLFVFLYLMGDADGDRVLDVAVDAIECHCHLSSTSESWVESGREGTLLWSLAFDGLALTLPAGDMDLSGKKKDVGDADHALFAGDDLYYVRFIPGGIGIDGIRVTRGDVIWSRTDLFRPAFDFFIAATGDQSGLGGADGVYSRLQLAPGGLEGRIDGLEGMTGNLTWGYGTALTPPPPPPPPLTNDDFGAALVIPAFPFNHTADTSGATTEPGEPQPCAPTGKTGWYRFTAPGDGSVKANTFGSGYDTVLAAYTGVTLTDLSTVACNDDFDGLQSQISFQVVAGVTYHLQVGGFAGSGGPLLLEVIGTFAPPPPPKEPFSQVFAEEGLIGCSVGFNSISTTDLCTGFGLTQGKTIHTFFPAVGDVTGAVYEVVWTPTGTFGGRYLALLFPAIVTGDVNYTTDDRRSGNRVTGESPIDLRIEATGATPLHQIHNGTPFRFEVRSAGSFLGDTLADPIDDGSGRLVLDQPYEIYVSLFFNGMPVPEGYSAVPG